MIILLLGPLFMTGWGLDEKPRVARTHASRFEPLGLHGPMGLISG